MYLTPDAHAQAVRDRQQALFRDAAAHRAVTRTRSCSPVAKALWRLAARLGAVTLAPDGCRDRRKPAVAGTR
jgi:hypothetical protein